MALRIPMTASPTVAVPVHRSSIPPTLLSRRRLQQVLGALWLLDGLLQLQPSMFTKSLVYGNMLPALQGQPAPIAAVQQQIIGLTGQHIVLANLGLLLVQITLGVCLLSGRFVRPALMASVGWSLLVWFGGEGMGMLLTGQASALTGAPGAVLLYAILGLAAYPRVGSVSEGLYSRRQLRMIVAGFWALTAVLQMQPLWWQSQQISQTITANEMGTLNGTILNGSLAWLARLTATNEAALNIGLIVLALGIAAGLILVRVEQLRWPLAASIALSLTLWWATEGCGQLLSGSATDPNSGPLLVLLALACWPVLRPATGLVAERRTRLRADAPASPFGATTE